MKNIRYTANYIERMPALSCSVIHQEADYEDNEENLPPPPKLDSRQKKELWGHLKARWVLMQAIAES